jgi:hypothetical protein
VLVTASTAFHQDVALIVTFFVAIGLIVNGLVVYIIGQVLAERRENQERRERAG